MAQVKGDWLLDAKGCRDRACIFRTNQNVLKLLLWHDAIPAREDLYRLIELLGYLGKVEGIPTLIVHLLQGFQERLLQVSDCQNYVDMIETFFQYKPMYHTCINTYFSEGCESLLWKFYICCCLEWRNNLVLEGCFARKYKPVDFLAMCPPDEDETITKDEQGSVIRVRAIQEYLTYFGSEGKKFFGKSAKYFETVDIESQLKSRRSRDDEELNIRKRKDTRDKPFTAMTKKEMRHEKYGVESKYNLHVTLIPYKDELITEGEFIERMERCKKGLRDYYCYSPDIDQTNLMERSIKEYFGREFHYLVEMNGEQVFPFNRDTGEVLYSIDIIEERIRNNEIGKKPRVSMQTLAELKQAKIGEKRYANNPVDDLFKKGTATSLSMRLSADEFVDMFAKDCPVNPLEKHKDELKTLPEKPIEVRYTLGNPQQGIEDKYDVDVAYEKPHNPYVIQRHKVWNANPGGFGLENFQAKPRPKTQIPLPRSPKPELPSFIPPKITKHTNILGGAPNDIKEYIIDLVDKQQIREFRKMFGSAQVVAVTADNLGHILGNLCKGESTTENDKVSAMRTDLKKTDAIFPDLPKEKPKDEETSEHILNTGATHQKSPESKGNSVEKIPIQCKKKEVQKEEDNSSIMADWLSRKCYICGTKGQMKKCGKCHGVDYCSRECQVKDWPEHKYICILIRDNMLHETP